MRATGQSRYELGAMKPSFFLKYGMSEPQTDAYFARTRIEPGGHSSIDGFGEGRTNS